MPAMYAGLQASPDTAAMRFLEEDNAGIRRMRQLSRDAGSLLGQRDSGRCSIFCYRQICSRQFAGRRD